MRPVVQRHYGVDDTLVVTVAKFKMDKDRLCFTEGTTGKIKIYLPDFYYRDTTTMIR